MNNMYIVNRFKQQGDSETMHRKVKTADIFSVIICVLILFSCNAGNTALKDGYYSAEAADFDSHGWKEYLSICVSGGKIILVEYDAFNASGFIKSWDMDYMRQMNAENGTYPNAYFRHYTGQLLKTQGVTSIDTLSGATTSGYTFLRLAEAVIENARKGNSKTALVDMNEVEEDRAVL